MIITKAKRVILLDIKHKDIKKNHLRLSANHYSRVRSSQNFVLFYTSYFCVW